jgi:peptidyl-prolyl cis-trans isomerase D
MLQSMRHLAQTWVFKTLMLILMVSFCLWGIGDVFKGNLVEHNVAKVGGHSISIEDLQHDFAEALARARQMFGPDMTAQEAKQMGLLDHTLDLMIDRSAIDQELQKLGINISGKVLLDRVAAQPQFRDKDGKFNAPLFRQLLAQSHLTEASFLEDGRQDMMRQQILDLFEVNNAPPATMVDALYQARGQKRIFDVIVLKNSVINSIPAADDKVLHDFYQSHQKLFSAPEYRGVTIARLANDDVAKDIKVSDEQLHKEYDSRSTQLTHPERRNFIQVVLQDEGKAKLMAAAARSGNGLMGAAKEKGYDAIPINQSEEASLPPELGKVVFSLPAGQIADPVKTGLGWHVVQTVKVIPVGKPDFESVKDELRDTVRRDQAVEAETRLVNQMDDQLAAGHSLEDIADSLKLRLIKIPAVDMHGAMPDGKAPVELPNKDEALKTAFGQNAGETSPIIDDKKGNYFVVRTDDITPAAAKPFDKVQSEVAAAWKASEQDKAAHSIAEKIADELRLGKAADSFANLGATNRLSKPISLLGDNDPEIPETLLPQMLKLSKGQAMTAALDGRQLIIRLQTLENAGVPDATITAKVSDTFKTDTQKELSEEYVKFLQTIFPVKINQDVLESVRQQGS